MKRVYLTIWEIARDLGMKMLYIEKYEYGGSARGTLSTIIIARSYTIVPPLWLTAPHAIPYKDAYMIQ
jgi:hypothetical protein